jgi:hypothetical protein
MAYTDISKGHIAKRGTRTTAPIAPKPKPADQTKGPSDLPPNKKRLAPAPKKDMVPGQEQESITKAPERNSFKKGPTKPKKGR